MILLFGKSEKHDGGFTLRAPRSEISVTKPRFQSAMAGLAERKRALQAVRARQRSHAARRAPRETGALSARLAGAATRHALRLRPRRCRRRGGERLR